MAINNMDLYLLDMQWSLKKNMTRQDGFANAFHLLYTIFLEN